jgi:CRP-like cAMP-binding protein
MPWWEKREMAVTDLADTIAGFALFADLTTPQREHVVDVFSEQWFADGEKVLRQGLTGSGLYVVLDGSAAIRIDGVDRATLRAGDYFGEISCLLGEPPTADIVAIGALRCLVLPSSQVEDFLKSVPSVMYRLLQGEARKVRTTTKWL